MPLEENQVSKATTSPTTEAPKPPLTQSNEVGRLLNALYYTGYTLSFIAFLVVFVLLPLFALQNWVELKTSLSPLPLVDLWIFFPPLIIFTIFLYLFPYAYLLIFLGTAKLVGVPRSSIRQLLLKISKAPKASLDNHHSLVVEIRDGQMTMQRTNHISLGKQGMIARVFYNDL